ncbi:hypothetical protein NQ314_016190 [Rhamnusium bicolor]|uniref:Retrotransposon gag domain-containing protein n=1 Tax=Rhamnusium bicolor TaxID=1586634 RepID=A0AAV8WWH4_9CUCU|nr:hypothetical protein NQ314_016190 [Rhamnusium bicolor]
MPRKLQVNRLEKEELTYELTVRGIATGNVEEMRRRLSQAIQLEKDGDSLKYPAYPYTFDQDYEEIKKKLDNLTDLVEVFDNAKGSNEALKLETKFSHTLGRLENMMCDDDGNKQIRKSELWALLLSLMEKFNEKIGIYEKRKVHVAVPSALSFVEGQVGASTFQRGLAQASRSSSVGDVNSPHASRNIPGHDGGSSKTIPPHKWNIQRFSGDKKAGMSINAFLERVEELRVARNVSKDTLFSAGIDLFCEKAYQFYKECRDRVNSWDEMVDEFREEYLSSSYEDELFEELQKRTQHSSETIGVYLAVMASYFNRLRCTISEEAKLKIILKNLHPFYLERLKDPLPTSLSDLRICCRSMEARRDMINRYVEPSSRRGNTLEKDLAYHVGSEDSTKNFQPVLDFILDHAQDDERPYLKVSVMGKPLLGLLDSGASSTIIGSKGWTLVNDLGFVVDTTRRLKCKMANGELVESAGECEIPFCVRNRVKLIKVLVVPELPHTLILGTNFWKHMGIVPDLRHNEWSFSSQPLCLDEVDYLRSKTVLTNLQEARLQALLDRSRELMGDQIGCTDLAEH